LIGAFVINDAKQVCFTQYGEHEAISALRIVPGDLCMVQLEDGSETMFTAALNPEIVAAMRSMNALLIVHMDDEGTSLKEYEVPLTIQL
jgi:hypothetical protein